MTKPWKTRILRAVKALLAAATLLVAALLIAQCADAYNVGASADNATEAGVRIRDMYSREIAENRLRCIAWSFYAWAALLALTLGLKAVFRETDDEKLVISQESRLEQALSRASVTVAMLEEERRRCDAKRLCATVCVVCATVAGAYFFNPNGFASRDLENVMGAMLLRVAPWVAAAFASIALLARAYGKSEARELDAAKNAPRRAPESPKARESSRLPYVRAALYACAALLVIAGIANGGMYDVLVKAINICTECIGLG